MNLNLERSNSTPDSSLKGGQQEQEKKISNLEFTSDDGLFYFREVYTNGTKGPLTPIDGIDTSMPGAFKIKRGDMIEEYEKKGLWAGKKELRADN